MAESNEILEGKYIRADKLQKAIHNFLRNKDKADMYREIAEIYKSLGDYKDSPAKYPITANTPKTSIYFSSAEATTP